MNDLVDGEFFAGGVPCHVRFESRLISQNFNQFNEMLNRGGHLFEAGPFQRRMRVVLAGGEIGRRQAAFGELRAVCAARSAASSPIT